MMLEKKKFDEYVYEGGKGKGIYEADEEEGEA